MAFRLRDMANGKYMNCIDDPEQESPTWSASGHFFETSDDLARQLRTLAGGGTKISPLWEVQECVVGLLDSFPASALPLSAARETSK